VTQRAALRLFPLWERIGLHVTPAHFYYPIPVSSELADGIFEQRTEGVGLDWNEVHQLSLLREVFPRYATEVEFPQNLGLSVVDAAILHAMIRHFRPAKIVEVGSGLSTEFAARACLLNAQEEHPCELVAIEPYPRPSLEGGFPGLTRLRKQRVQDVEMAEFEDADLLFIDSSHVVKVGSDVNFLLLEVLPRLKPGCMVHLHDIVLPGEYWKDWVIGRRRFWSEQYLLHAFLLFNSAFDVLWGSRYMQLGHAGEIAKTFPYYHSGHRITSFWMRRRLDPPESPRV
jgi:hypothetical protein